MNKSKYCGITGDELANMLRKPSKYSKKEAEEIIEKAEELTPLEALGKIKDNMAYQIQLRGDCVVVPEFDIVEKHLKALEIIKEKKVDVYTFLISVNCKHYNFMIDNRDRYLTQEEFDLLKEVLHESKL